MSADQPVTLYRVPAARRRELLEPHIGRAVLVTVETVRGRGDRTQLAGRLIALADPLGGTSAELLILRLAHLPAVPARTVAVSAATVVALEEL